MNRFNSRVYTQDILFPEGSYVMIMDVTQKSKLDPIYEGLFKVMRHTHGGSYILQDNDGRLLSHNYLPSALKLISQDPIFSGQAYEISAILDHHDSGNHCQYLVHWKGYDKAQSTWEPIENFNDIDIINQYWKQKGMVVSRDV